MDLICSEIQPENRYFQITSNVSLSFHPVYSFVIEHNGLYFYVARVYNSRKTCYKTFCLQQSIFVCHVNTSYVWLAYENAATKP